MNKVIRVKETISITRELNKQNKTIVVVGGCFDILHFGHLLFLEKAKEKGDVLFVFLESDETIHITKGDNRPINTQKDRALKLSMLDIVDYIILLPQLKKDREYDNLLLKIKPTIIATTKGDPKRYHKERQAKLMGITVIDVMERIRSKSTSNLAKLLFL